MVLGVDVNLSSLPYMAEGAMLADVVAPIGTIDIVLGSVSRQWQPGDGWWPGPRARDRVEVPRMATLTSRPATAPAELRIVLDGVSWDTHERLLADYVDSSVPHFTYDGGVLEIVRPSRPHEEDNRTLATVDDIEARESPAWLRAR